MLYGQPKIGKSTWASQFDTPLFLATEEGLNALATFKLTIRKWEDFKEVLALFESGNDKYKTIVIDTIDNLARLCSDYVCRKNGVEHESEIGYGKGWELTRTEFLKTLTRYSQLPQGLIMISHSKEEEIKTKTSVLNKAMPTLKGSYRDIALGMADIILYAHSVQKLGKDAKIEEIRMLRTKATENWEAGDRTGKLPESIIFNYEEFKNAWESAKNG